MPIVWKYPALAKRMSTTGSTALAGFAGAPSAAKNEPQWQLNGAHVTTPASCHARDRANSGNERFVKTALHQIRS